MPKRSPWAAQPKDVVRKLRFEHSAPPLSADYLQAARIKEAGVENAQLNEKREFIRRHARLVAGFVGKSGKTPKAHADNILGALREPGLLSEPDVNKLVRIAAHRLIEREAKNFLLAFPGKIEAYLKGRKMPIDRKLVAATGTRYLHLHGLKGVIGGINLAEIEKRYLELRKSCRWETQEMREDVNMFLQKASRGIRLNPEQRRRMKKWISKNYAVHIQNLKRISRESHGDYSAALAKFRQMNAEFEQSISNEIKARFGKQPRQKAEPMAPIAPARKLGAREERIASHVPREKSETERAKQMDEVAEVSKQLGQPFNQAEYCLGEIGKESPETSAYFRGLLADKNLSGNSLTRLFTSGSLTQRIFVRALKNTPFIQRFGVNEINALARGLSFIGPKGKQITMAVRAFQSPTARDIYGFLEGVGLIETQHGGGTVVYLKRTPA